MEAGGSSPAVTPTLNCPQGFLHLSFRLSTKDVMVVWLLVKFYF